MSRQPEEVSAPERRSRRAAWAWSLVALGLLLITWPFLRTPLLGIGPSYGHVLGAWALIVVALALLSRAIGRDRGERGDGGEGA
jgi:hypothetical protein